MGRGVPDEGGVTVLGGTVAVAVAVAEADGRPNSTKGAGMPQREREGQPGPARSDAAPVGDQARALGHPSRYAIFEQLRLWVEKNENGACEEGETTSLREAGVKSIDLGYKNVREDDGKGNLIGQTGSFTRTDGSQGLAADVWLQNKG